MLHLVKPFNFILACDSYKTNHYLEIPAGVTEKVSVMVPRKLPAHIKAIVAAGHGFVAHILSTVRITYEMIDEAEKEINEQGYEFNRADWEYIVREYDGRLPLAMYGVEEGTVIQPQTPMAAFINTGGEQTRWLPSYVETWTQSTMWKMSTVASISREALSIVIEFMTKTGSDMSNDAAYYKVHNFGDRGADSPDEAAVLAGIAHAMVFNGSDCTRANGYIKTLYNTNKSYTSSVEATEHSTMCANSDAVNKDDFGAAQMVVNRLYKVVERSKRGIGIPVISAVIDTYDDERFVRDYIGGHFRDAVINSGGRLVFRPDSGDPMTRPGHIGMIAEQQFGEMPANDKGYRGLHPAIGVLQGDGIRIETMRPVFQGWINCGFNIDNFLVGMGGGLTHEGSRDLFSFSMKSVAMKRNGKWERMLKEPKTDVGKKSLSGLVRNVYSPDGQLHTVDCTDNPDFFFVSEEGWRLYSKDGERDFCQSYDDVRVRARANITE